MLLRSGQFRRLGITDLCWIPRVPNTETVYTSSLENKPVPFVGIFNLPRSNTKRGVVLVRLRDWKGKERLVGVRVMCMRVCIMRETDSRGREREIEGPSKKKKSPSCVRVKISNDRACFFSSFTFLFFNFTATTTPLSGDRATRLVLGSCPYHGTSHRCPFSKAKGTAYGCFRKWVDTSRSVSIEGRSRDEV